jgi:Na+:H+ antiporter
MGADNCFYYIFFRGLLLKLLKLPVSPLLFIAPRGLITILLFLAIMPTDNIALVNTSLVIQVIILTALVMMIGLMFFRKPDIITIKKEKIEETQIE